MGAARAAGLAAGVALLLAACGGGDNDADERVTPQSVRPAGYAQLDAAGGTVEGVDGARVVVPAQALASGRTVAIARDSTGMPDLPAGTAPISDVWALTPHGVRFAQPVTVRIPFDATRLGADERPVLLKGSVGGGWQLIEDVQVQGGFIEAQLRSFSFLVVRGVRSTGVLPRAGDPPSTNMPSFSVTVTNGDFPTLNVTGFNAVMRQQPSPAVPASVRFNVRVPSGSALANFCGPGEANQLHVTRHTLPVTTYHLPGDGAGVNRLAAYFRAASWQPLVLNPAGATEAEQLRLPLDTDIVVNQSINAMDTTWREWPTQHSSYYYGWADALVDELPPGAVEDAWGVMVKLVLSCGPYGLPVMPDTVPPVVIVRGFANDVILIDGPPSMNAAFPGQQVQATLNTVLASNFELGRVDWVVKRPGSNTWEGVPAFLSATPPGGLTMWNSGGTLRMVASLADNGTRIRAAACAEVRSDLINNPAVTQGLQATGCATSAEGVITVASQFPQPRIVAQPGPAAWRAGDLITLRAEFEAFPLPPRTAPDVVVWQTRANANAPWGGLPNAVNIDLAPEQATTAWLTETRGTVVRTDRREAWAFSLVPSTMADNGRQFRVIFNLNGTTLTSNVLTLSVSSGSAPPVFTTQPAAVTVQSGSAATLAAAVSGGTPMSYRWLFNGQPVMGANAPTLALPTVNSANAGDYVLEASNAEATVRSNAARLSVTAAPPPPVDPPALAAPLASVTVAAGSTASFSVAATGGAPLVYQWRRNGADLAGATGPVLSLTNVTVAQAGAYTVRVQNNVGSVLSSEATLTVTEGGTPQPPVITTAPLGISVNPGQTAVLAVAASGSGTLSYAWQRDGQSVAGASGPVLVISTAQAADAGTYTVIVSNAQGSVTSAPAGLLVLPTPGAPSITVQPAAASVVSGAAVRFTATVTGNPAPQCLWLRDGIIIAGASDCTGLSVAAAQPEDNGMLYNLVAYNAGGAVVGNGALLTVTVPPTTVVATLTAGTLGLTGNADGVGAAAQFNTANFLALGPNGDLAVGDFINSTLRIVAPDGNVSTRAGTPGLLGYADGIGSAARFRRNGGVAFSVAGDVYLADWDNHAIRRITPDGTVSTFAGSGGVAGAVDGIGTAARLRNPSGLAIDASGNLFVADWGNHTIRRITPAGVVSTLAGSPGVPGSADGSGSLARFQAPSGLAVDGSGNVYVADQLNHVVRRITPAGVVSTLAGTAGQAGDADGTRSAARLRSPAWLSVSPTGDVFVVSAAGDTVRKISPAGDVATVVGVLGSASPVALGSNPLLRNARGVWAVSSQELYLVADHAVLHITLP